ncbi:unnamed protein product [Owenia fusiformis]|uniref:Uncharacterized protein n=1 Tax=Owenia fusiformis TaxID=6347 RepID=A0A8J1TIV7_OWEFU|nr:unnamed protein product [Owenia fusiformis]
MFEYTIHFRHMVYESRAFFVFPANWSQLSRWEEPTNSSVAIETSTNPYQQSRDHQCEVCLKIFTTKYTMKRHMNTHTGNKPYACNLCPMRFAHTGSLSFHKKSRGHFS